MERSLGLFPFLPCLFPDGLRFFPVSSSFFQRPRHGSPARLGKEDLFLVLGSLHQILDFPLLFHTCPLLPTVFFIVDSKQPFFPVDNLPAQPKIFQTSSCLDEVGLNMGSPTLTALPPSPPRPSHLHPVHLGRPFLEGQFRRKICGRTPLVFFPRT